MVPLPVREHSANTPGKKVPAGPIGVQQRARVSLVSVSTEMGRPSPCCASAASADAAAAPMTKTNSRRLLRSSRRRPPPQERGARRRAVSRGQFSYLFSKLRGSKQTVGSSAGRRVGRGLGFPRSL